MLVWHEPAAALQEPLAEWRQAAEHWITAETLKADVRFLAHDLLEGRGPGTRGDLLAQQYIATQFELLGLKPVQPGAGWVQPVPMVGVTTRAPEFTEFRAGDKTLQLKHHDDTVLTCGQPVAEGGVKDAELVFAGYGIQAPEFNWDDFRDTDVRGKVLVIMNNDPAGDPELFAGSTRLYYGRWDYKFEKGAELGAAGMLIIHSTPSAGYPFQVIQSSWTGEQMQLRGRGDSHMPMEGWLSEDAARRLVALGGKDLDTLRASAETREFRPVPLGITMSVTLPALAEERETGNVLALLPGSDPELAKEWVIVCAHHDHLGMEPKRDENHDNIFNGAVDNASGSGVLLGIARAITSLPESQRPKRSIFFAAVGAEEQGLLGSEYLALNPPTPAGYLAGIVNIDGINILGPTEDVVVIGKGKSDLDGIVQRIATWQKRTVVPDQFPDHGYYYRSDQFSLAKVGVPGVYLHSGVHVIGKPDGWGREKLREWTDTIYHQTSDEFDEHWDLSGAVLDAHLLCHVTLEIANRPGIPAWVPGDEFETARKAAISSR